MSDKQQELADVSLETIKGGAAIELFNYELAKVLANIADLNTEADEVREITLKVAFKPSADRDSMSYGLKCKANKLAGVKGTGGVMYLGARGIELVAVEYDPQQAQLFDSDAGADITPLSAIAGGKDEG